MTEDEIIDTLEKEMVLTYARYCGARDAFRHRVKKRAVWKLMRFLGYDPIGHIFQLNGKKYRVDKIDFGSSCGGDLFIWGTYVNRDGKMSKYNSGEIELVESVLNGNNRLTLLT